MKRLRDLPLTAKLMLFAALVATVSLGGTFAFVFARDVSSFRGDLVDRAVLVARVVGDYSAPDLVFHDREASEKTLALLKGLPEVRWAAVYDLSGSLFSSYRRAPGLTIPPVPSAVGAEWGEGLLLVTRAFAVPGEGQGTISLGISTESLDARVRERLKTTLLALLGILAGAVLLALLLQKTITAPLLELVTTARRISLSPDYSIRARKPAEDEIGALYDAFNEMLSQIQRREEERQRADQRTREKSLFLAHMSHELRTPLNSIIGFSDVLLSKTRDRLNEREQRFLTNIGTSGRHLLGIINGILDLSKIEAGKMELVLDELEPAAVLQSVVHVVRGVSARKEVSIFTDVPEDLPPLVADETKVKEILYNLLSNAVKFSPPQTTVTVTARSLPPATGGNPLQVQALRLSVRDEGIGIDPRDHEVIFEEFRQLDGTAGRRYEGTGLGLALVKRFAELHGGAVGLESARGAGSTFHVTLPLVPAAAKPAAASRPGGPGDGAPTATGTNPAPRRQ